MGLGIAFWVLAAIGSSNITPTDKADAEAPTDAGAEAKAKSVNDDTSNDKLAYDYGKCLVVYQNGASNIYLAIKDGRISKDSENKMLYNFNRKQAAYWGYKSAILSAEYSDKNKFEKLSNQFLNEKVMPIINDANALAELFKPLYIECKVPSEDFAAFAAEVRRTNPDPSDEDPVGTFATQFKQPPLD